MDKNKTEQPDIFLGVFPLSISDKDESVIFKSRKIVNLSRIDSYSFEIVSDLIIWEDFEVLYSWSYNGKSFNSWKSLRDFSGLDLSGDKEMWLKVGVVRIYHPSCPIKVNSPIEIKDFNFSVRLLPKVLPETSHTFDGLGGSNFYGSQYVDQKIEKTFDIYNLGNYFQIYKEISNVIHDYVGLDVEYVKTVPDDDTVDHFFREYSINREFKVKEFKIVVPGNEVHSQFPQFNPMSIDFADIPWEVHIVKERFEQTFNYKSRPIVGDFLYLPLTNKMYMVNGVVLDKSYMQATGSFYRVSLVKYENQAKISKKETTIDNLKLLTNSQSDFEDEHLMDFNDIVKPKEHDVLLSDNNWVWLSKNDKVITSNTPLEKNYVIISKNHYDFNKVGELEEAIVWNSFPEILDELSITFWFNTKSIENIYPLFSIVPEGKDSNSYYMDNADGLFVEITKTGVSFQDNIQEASNYKLLHTIQEDNWYAVVINISNIHNEVSLFLWGTNKERNSRLTLHNKITIPLNKDIFVNKKDLPNWRALGGNYKLTNMKVMSKVISEENQSLFLTQYIVNDSKNIYFVDTARPILDVDIQYTDKSQKDRLRKGFK